MLKGLCGSCDSVTNTCTSNDGGTDGVYKDVEHDVTNKRRTNNELADHIGKSDAKGASIESKGKSDGGIVIVVDPS